MLSAVALAREIETGAATAADIIDRCKAAIDDQESLIGAFETLDLDAARFNAEKAEGPLFGLPVGVKDIIDTADLPTRSGSPIYLQNQPATDAAIVSLVKRAGGVVAGKTVTTEFAFFQPGKTRNPRVPGHTPGGSSSGSAAAVAAGMLPLAIGTQTGGSVIRPASFCGVAGYKPTFTMLPTVGMKTFSWTLDTMGLFGAGVADAAFFAAALTGRDLRVDGTELKAPRIGIAQTHIWHEASGEMRVAVETAARLAEKAGASIREVTLARSFSDAFAAHQTIQDYEVNQALAFERDRHGEALSLILRDTLDAGRAIAPEDYDHALAQAGKGRHALGEAFADVDVLLTPSAPGAAPEGLASTGSSIFNRLWTLMGTPTVNVPGLANGRGLPLGVQIVAPRGKDRRALEAAAWLEGVLAGAPAI